MPIDTAVSNFHKFISEKNTPIRESNLVWIEGVFVLPRRLVEPGAGATLTIIFDCVSAAHKTASASLLTVSLHL